MEPIFQPLIQHVERHIRLDHVERDFFVSMLEQRTLRKGEFLFEAGDPCKYEHYIASGCMRVFTTDEKGQEHILFFGIEDWWVGDLYSFLTQTPATCSVQALEPTHLLLISKPKLDVLYERVPAFERFFRLLIQNAFIAQQKRIQQNLTLTADERLDAMLERYPNIEQRVAQKHIARYLGITPAFLSMMRAKRWEK